MINFFREIDLRYCFSRWGVFLEIGLPSGDEIMYNEPSDEEISRVSRASLIANGIQFEIIQLLGPGRRMATSSLNFYVRAISWFYHRVSSR